MVNRAEMVRMIVFPPCMRKLRVELEERGQKEEPNNKGMLGVRVD